MQPWLLSVSRGTVRLHNGCSAQPVPQPTLVWLPHNNPSVPESDWLPLHVATLRDSRLAFTSPRCGRNDSEINEWVEQQGERLREREREYLQSGNVT